MPAKSNPNHTNPILIIPEMVVMTGGKYDVVVVDGALHWFSTQRIQRCCLPIPGALVQNTVSSPGCRAHTGVYVLLSEPPE